MMIWQFWNGLIELHSVEIADWLRNNQAVRDLKNYWHVETLGL